MQHWKTKPKTRGFTVMETVISLAIIAGLTASLLVGFGQNVKNERFTVKVNEFAAALREAQTRSYSVNAGECTGAAGTLCYWRGTVLEYQRTPGGGQPPYVMRLLSGQDYAEIPSRDQKYGITGKSDPPLKRYNLELAGVELNSICLNEVTDTNINDPINTVTISGRRVPVCNDGSFGFASLSVAFLSPDARSYYTKSIVTAFNAALAHYNDQEPVKFLLSSHDTDLLGSVIFYPRSGRMEVRVE